MWELIGELNYMLGEVRELAEELEHKEEIGHMTTEECEKYFRWFVLYRCRNIIEEKANAYMPVKNWRGE